MIQVVAPIGRCSNMIMRCKNVLTTLTSVPAIGSTLVFPRGRVGFRELACGLQFNARRFTYVTIYYPSMGGMCVVHTLACVCYGLRCNLNYCGKLAVLVVYVLVVV